MIVPVTDATFAERVLRAELPVLLDFTADWCPPCRMIKPVLREISDELAGRGAPADLGRAPGPDAHARFALRAVRGMDAGVAAAGQLVAGNVEVDV
jgi:thiol-disulfide isomerase/thioredoxin